MPRNLRKKAKSALEQNRRQTQKIPADSEPQQKAGEKVGLDFSGWGDER